MTHLPDFKRDLLRAGEGWHAAPARRRRAVRRLAGVAARVAVVAAVVAGLVALLAAGDRREVPAEGDAPDAILYTKVVFERSVIEADGSRSDETGSIEEWRRGSEAHRITRTGASDALDHVIGADGVMRQIDADGGYRIVRAGDNADSRNVIAEERRGLVAEFLARYRKAEPDPAGDVRFAGRPARRRVHRQVIEARDQDGNELDSTLGPRQSLYVDLDGRPLGSTSSETVSVSVDGGQSSRRQTWTYRETFTEIRELEPTPSNEAKLREFVLTRKRDRDGCVRGPTRGRMSQDEAPRSDCGGKPFAPVEVP